MPTILVRKGYHLLALALFAPALTLEPQLLAVSLAVALALLVAVEVVRLGQVPFIGGFAAQVVCFGGDVSCPSALTLEPQLQLVSLPDTLALLLRVGVVRLEQVPFIGIYWVGM